MARLLSSNLKVISLLPARAMSKSTAEYAANGLMNILWLKPSD